MAIVAAYAAPARADTPNGLCENGLLLVGAMVPPEQRRASDQIYTSAVLVIRDAIQVARRFGSKDSPCAEKLPFADVDSYDDLILRAEMKVQVAERRYLQSTTMRTVLGKRAPLAGYVGIQVLSRQTGVAVLVVLYRAVKGGELEPVRRKVVSTELGEDELLQLVAELGRHIVSEADEPPVADIRGGSDIKVLLGHEVTLDAELSSDPEFDQLKTQWRQLDRNPSNDLHVDGSARSLLRLRPAAPGTYRFCLQVADQRPLELGSAFDKCTGSPAFRAVTVTVGVAPNLGPDVHQFETTVPVAVPLDAPCPEGATCEWAQLDGPDLRLCTPLSSATPSAAAQLRSTCEAPATNSANITIPGFYKVQQRARNDFGVASRTWSIVAAPPPVIVWQAPRHVSVGYRGILDASGSYDPLGQPLSYLWTTTPADGKYDPDCTPEKQQDEATFATSPTGKDTFLQTGNPGRHPVWLRVTAPRPFDGHTVMGTATRSTCVEVVPKRFEALVGFHTSWSNSNHGKVQVGLQVGGSIGIDTTNFRIHLNQALFHDAPGDGYGLIPFGGAVLALSYAFQPDQSWLVRPMLGGALSSLKRTSEEEYPYFVPRVALDVANVFSGWFAVILNVGFEAGFRYFDSHAPNQMSKALDGTLSLALSL